MWKPFLGWQKAQLHRVFGFPIGILKKEIYYVKRRI